MGGAALVLASASFGWLPVLGQGTALLGFGMIAGEVRAVAGLVDRLEVGARRLLGPPGRAFARLSAWARLPVSQASAVYTLALAKYGLYALVFGGHGPSLQWES